VFWSAVWLLIRLRLRLAVRTLSRNPTAVIGSTFALLVLTPAAVAAGGLCQQRFASLPPPRDALFLRSVLLTAQALWLLLLLPAAGVALGRDLPSSVLRPFPLRRGQAVIADALGALFDLPTLLAIPLFVAVVRHFDGHSSPVGMALVQVALILFCLQTVALWRFMVEGASYLSRRFRGAAMPLLALLLLTVCLSTCLPYAFAATAVSSRSAQQVAADPIPLLNLTPVGFVAAVIEAAHRGAWGAAILHLAAVLAIGAGLLAGADSLHAAAERATEQRSNSRSYHRSLAPEWSTPALSQIAAAIGAEWRCLTRDPGSHLPLRAPAMLLLICFFGWISPNLGNDPFLNLRDLLGMGGLLYILLWQVQLLCNRFGNEAGTAQLLFGFPTPRRYLLAGRNFSLAALLIPLDGALVIGLCVSAHAAHFIGPLLGWGAMALVVVTALGNVASACLPFPIRRQGERYQAEPERSVAFVYVALGFATAALLWPVHYLADRLSWWVASPLATLYLSGMYLGCLHLAEWLLAQRERRLARLLDGDLA
jgi:hypothetical protein